MVRPIFTLDTNNNYIKLVGGDMQSNTIRVTVQEYEEIQDPMGTVKEWSDVETYWATKIYISIEGREKFQQIGHSDIDFYLRFSHPIDISLADNRFKIVENDNPVYYEAIEPPQERGLISRRSTKIAVKEVTGDE